MVERICVMEGKRRSCWNEDEGERREGQRERRDDGSVLAGRGIAAVHRMRKQQT